MNPPHTLDPENSLSKKHGAAGATCRHELKLPVLINIPQREPKQGNTPTGSS